MIKVKKIQIFYFVFGLLLFSLGITLTINAGLGVSAWDAVYLGMYHNFGLRISFWLNLQSFILILLGGIMKQERPKLECLVVSLITSVFIELFIFLLGDVVVQGKLMQLLFFIVGVIVLSAGCGMYLVPPFAPGPVDYFMLGIKHIGNSTIAKAMTICELSGLSIALVFRGPIGIGTVISVFVYGPLIQFFHLIFVNQYKCLVKQKK